MHKAQSKLHQQNTAVVVVVFYVSCVVLPKGEYGKPKQANSAELQTVTSDDVNICNLKRFGFDLRMLPQQCRK